MAERAHPQGNTPAPQGLSGPALAVAAQVIWGMQPLFWPLLAPMSTTLILAHRIAWSWVVAGVVVLARPASRAAVRTHLRNPRTVRGFAAAGVLMGICWGVYIYGIVIGHVVEMSLSLFVAPLLTAVAGVVVLREPLRPPQWCAVGIAVVAVLVLTFAYGRVPWLALLMAFLLAVYALVKKGLADVPAAPGMALETTALMPVALGFLIWTSLRGGAVLGGLDPGGKALLIPVGGLVSTLPLICVAASLSRVPLSTYGLLMYLNPIIQFVIGAWVRHEPLSSTSWIGFGLIWCALTTFAADSLMRSRAPREPVASPA